ncbi:fungal-specific transcription factor domain-containing protein [Thelonectria olida]|uniref:Fungal-specific transcription factor domain-containing protein n=1 Tax=Thelonectria olida TaxID=1576542 RepID=A0A9P8W2K2_9HYPO|nr:fungal-specific transcription factor domain-containing protein [Thelonectria olida]
MSTLSASTNADLRPQDAACIGSSDQACKECRRRKARCNRALPTCDLCIRYRRHCLYEKHSRTPLTRKHLTEVETRLERAEALVKQMRTLVPPHLRSWERGGNSPGTAPVNPQIEPPTSQGFNFSTAPTPQTGHPPVTGHPGTDPPPNASLPSSADRTQGPSPPNVDHQRLLEGPPEDDFDWCEKTTTHVHGLSPDAITEAPEEDSPISDGMASLTVNEGESGYLGVASGAALLRLLEPRSRRRLSKSQHNASSIYPMIPQPNPNRHIAESMIDSYFRLYHVSYPIIHEPTFRAQYSEVIPRPNETCWTVLAYVVAAIGVWASSTSSAETLDMALFQQASSILSFDFLEVGNLPLVQALTLASNYQQKRDKPNSGYNYLGLAVRMAMGLGLHKEFQGWNISPLNMEIRRRVWWSLCVFDVGATITFSRPDVWPYKGVEVSFPLNVNDKDLTAASTSYPPESNQITPYTAVTTQARFHIATHECYDRIISKPFPSAGELLKIDSGLIETWQAEMPVYFREQTPVPPRYAFCQAVMSWRVRNLRIILYRPFVIRRALRRRADAETDNAVAYDRCLADAKSSIQMIAEYWESHEHNRLAAWYSLYFLFQAALIPCICLRNQPSAPEASDWRAQITQTLQTITALSPANASSPRCYQVISDLCGRYLDSDQAEQVAPPAPTGEDIPAGTEAANQPVDLEQWTSEPVEESPQTQINNVFSMMWPNAPPMEVADVVMGDDTWMNFLRVERNDDWEAPSS